MAIDISGISITGGSGGGSTVGAKLRVIPVDALPDVSTAKRNVLYIVKTKNTTAQNKFDEFFVNEDDKGELYWELFGRDVTIDLSAYALKTEVAKKQDKLVNQQNLRSINNVSLLGPGNVNFDFFDNATQKTKVVGLLDKVGDLSKLKTSNKLNLVDAINEAASSSVNTEDLVHIGEVVDDDIADIDATIPERTAILEEKVDALSKSLGNASSCGGGVTKTTYNELKSLRDNGELSPGTWYRITDYQCTTTQESTRSAGHPFDILVLALDEHTLSEEARACVNEEYENATSFVDDGDHCVNTGEVFAVTANGIRTEHMTFFRCYDYESIAGYMISGNITDWSKKNAHIVWVNEDEGDVIDVENKTAKIDKDLTNECWSNIISFFFGYFSSSNLSAWKIWYCLDNDETRFAWAQDGIAFTLSTYGQDEGSTQKPTRRPEFDNMGSEYKYAWGTDGDVEDGDPTDFIYTKSESPKHGDSCLREQTLGRVIDGHGVIYRMIDEWNNDVPYDFKNIQFKRAINEDGNYDPYNGEETWVYTFAGRSYHIDNDEYSDWKDGSLESPYGHMSDENLTTFINNVVKPYILFYDSEYEDITKCGKARLNDIVLFGYWEETGSTEDEYAYYHAHCCYSNTFGSNCHANTFGNDCYSNTFGNNCYANTFGNDCYSNTFGNDCGYNTFGSNCYYNTFGNDCSANTFGYDCDHNMFGNYCYWNTFGNDCSANTFGYDCDHNTFGRNCCYNTFGNGCSNNTSGNSSSIKGYMKNITLENGVSFTYINCSATTSSSKRGQNIHVNSGVAGTSSTNSKTLTISTAGNNFLTTFGSSNDTTINV